MCNCDDCKNFGYAESCEKRFECKVDAKDKIDILTHFEKIFNNMEDVRRRMKK